MFSKTNKRISLNPLDNRQYDNDKTPIMTDYTPPTPTTPAPTYGNGRGNGGGSGGEGRTLRSAPIHLPSSQSNHANAPPTPRSPAYPRQHQYGHDGTAGGGGGGGGNGGGARRHNTYHQGHHQHHQRQQQQRSQNNPPRGARSVHHHNNNHNQNYLQNAPPSPMYPPSPSTPTFRGGQQQEGYQSTPQMYAPKSPSSHNQYPPSSPGSPLPLYVERPAMAVINHPPQYSSHEMSYNNSNNSRGGSGGNGGGQTPSRSTSDPELALYESSQYYTNRNRKQQEHKERERRRLQQRQEEESNGECCGCFKSMAEFCPCLCFCCMFGGVAMA